MTPETVVDIFRNAIYLTTLMVFVLVTPGLIVGLMVAMFQAATQINEMSMSFVPKMLITLTAGILTGPWLLNLVVDYARRLITEIPMLIG